MVVSKSPILCSVYKKYSLKRNQTIWTTSANELETSDERLGLLLIRHSYTSVKQHTQKDTIQSCYFVHLLLLIYMTLYINKIENFLAR